MFFGYVKVPDVFLGTIYYHSQDEHGKDNQVGEDYFEVVDSEKDDVGIEEDDYKVLGNRVLRWSKK